jgi:hypothetical protein
MIRRDSQITTSECKFYGGEIIDKSNFEDKSCPNNNVFLGTVSDLNCPCICCRK